MTRVSSRWSAAATGQLVTRPAGAVGDRPAAEPHPVLIAAARGRDAGRNRHVLHGRPGKHRPAPLRFVAEPGDLGGGEPAGGIVELQPRPRKVLRVAPHIVAAEEESGGEQRQHQQAAEPAGNYPRHSPSSFSRVTG